MATLSERDMRILAFERSWWRQPGAKEQAISDLLGLSATRYYQLLNELIDRPEALGFDPVLVKRLRRQRCPPRKPDCGLERRDPASDRARALHVERPREAVRAGRDAG